MAEFPRDFFRRLLPLMLAGACLAGGGGAFAHAVHAPSLGRSISLAPFMEQLEDPEKRWSVFDVSNPPVSQSFTPVGDGFYSNLISSSAFWYRVSIHNPGPKPARLILANSVAWLDLVEVYSARSPGGFSLMKSGDSIPFSQRAEPHPTNVFPITLAPDEEKTYYIRVTTVDAFLSPFTLWDEEAFKEADAGRTLYFGVILGIITIMFFYNMILMIFLRDGSYLHYNVYLFVLGIWFFTYNGFSYRYLWPDSPWLQNRMMVSLDYAMQLCAVLFARSFLDAGKFLPPLERVFRAAIAFYAVMIALDIFSPYHYATGLVCLTALQVYGPLLSVSGYAALRAGVRSARFFLLAWICTTVGVSITALIVVGVLPYDWALFRVGEIGVMADIILLALALADRINILRIEKEEAQRLSREVLEESSRVLAEKVAERTAELKEARDRAEDATRLKDKFVSLVSHDLRSPLGSALGLLNAMTLDQEGAENRKRNKDYLGRAVQSMEGLLKMIEQLLNLSRIRTGRIVPLKRFFNVHERVNLLLSVMEPQAAQKGIRLVNDLPRGMRLLADQDLYQEVIRNLISNAIKFCSKGDVVTIYSPSGQPEAVAVRDSGPGMDAELQTKIFVQEEKASRAGSAGEKGSGLGLSFSREIMLAHGGSLTVSPLKKGAEFCARLPPPLAIILLVDDKPNRRADLRGAIQERIRAEILEAGGGVEALEMLKQVNPSVVAFSMGISDIRGLDFLKMAKSAPAPAAQPVIALVEQSSPEEDAKACAEAMALGADAAFVLPAQREDLMGLLLRLAR